MARSDRAAQDVVATTVIAAAVVASFLLAWWARHVFLLGFAGVLLAVLLDGLASLVAKLLSIPRGYALLTVLVFLLALTGGAGWLLGERIAEQVDRLFDQLPQSLARLRERLGQYVWGQRLLEWWSGNKDMLADSSYVARAGGVLSTTLGALTGFVLVLFLGLFLAVEPAMYFGGAVRLIPPRHRPQAREVLLAVHATLWWWLVGKLCSMTIVGVVTWLGLWMLDIPLALTLGILAGLLSFIPNFGPILSAVPALLLAWTQGLMPVLYVALLYVGLQTAESYLITPLIQRRAVSMPPGLIIFAQLLLGFLLGPLGLVLATPLVAGGIVLTKKLYIEDTLGDGDEG